MGTFSHDDGYRAGYTPDTRKAIDDNLRAKLRTFILKIGNLTPSQMRDAGIDLYEWNDLLTLLKKTN